MSEQRSHTDKLASALLALDIVNELLVERGYTPDSSARHNLSIARSLLKDVLTDEEVSRG
jgi:hypothetical protein